MTGDKFVYRATDRNALKKLVMLLLFSSQENHTFNNQQPNN
jgi:hypothetical protein